MSSAPPTKVRWLVLAALCAMALLAYLQRNALQVVEENVRCELRLSTTDLGWILWWFFLAYSLGQLPTAWLAQRWGPRLALSWYMAICAGLTAVTVVCTDYWALLLSRVGLGVAQAGLFPCAAAIIAVWFPSSRRAFATGALGAAMSVGAAVAAFLTAELLRVLPWTEIFLLYALPASLWALWFLLWYRERPEEHPRVNAAERELLPERGAAPIPERGPIPWGALLTSPALWWICGQQFFRAAGYIFFSSWFAVYLKETRGLGTQAAGWLTSLPLFAVVLGSLAGGALSDALLRRTGSRVLARQGLSVVMLSLCAGCILAAWFVQDALTAVLLISLGSFLASLAAPCAYAITIDLGGTNLPTVFALMNMAGNLGAAAFPVLIPYLVRWTGNWDAVLFAFAGIYVAAAVCWWLIPAEGEIGQG